MKTNETIESFTINSVDQIDTVALALAMRRAKEKGWITQDQLNAIVTDAGYFAQRLARGEMITLGDLDATSTGTLQ